MKSKLLTLIVALLAGIGSFATEWTALTLGEAVSVPTGESFWSVTADKDGTMVLTAAEGGYWINNLEVYSDAEGASPIMIDANNTATRFAAKKGDTYYIAIWNYEDKSGSMVATVEETNANNYPALQLDEVFVIKNFGEDIWSYTAIETGTAKIVGVGDDEWIGSCLLVYDDAGMTHEVQLYNYSYYEFATEAGHTYYIKNWNWTGQDFKGKIVQGATKLTLTGSDPADNGMFYITSDNNAVLTFSSAVTFTEGELSVNGNMVKIYNFNDYNSLVANGTFTYTQEGSSGLVNWNGNICARSESNKIVVSFTSATGYSFFNVVNRLLEEGKIKAGDQMTLTMHGIQSTMTGELLNNDGNLTQTWTFAGEPTKLVSATVPETIKSWYNEGDPEGIATFTFSRPIRSAMAILEMGMGEGADDLYTEYVADDHVVISGNTVKVDFSGVMRTKTTMNLKMNWNEFTLQLTNVVDENGNATFSEDLGSASTYTFTAKYQDISKTLSYEITPMTGSTLTADNREVEIWLGNVDLIEYDGVNITYYTMDEVADVDMDGNPVTTLQNVAHNTFVPRAQLKEVADVEGITITCPLPEGIHQAQNVCLKLNVTSSTDGQEHIVAAYYNTSLMYGLPVDITAEPASESTVDRLTEIYFPLGFVYSINNNLADKITVTSKTDQMFSCGARMVAEGKVLAKIVLDEPISDEGAYTVSVPAGVIGDYNYGESGYTSGTTHEAFNLYYAVSGKYAGKSVICEPFDGETVQRLNQFIITFFDYNSVAPTWDVEKYAYVKDGDGKEYLGTFAENTGTVSNQLVFTLDKPITEAGTYTFVLTSGSVANGATGDPITTQYEFTYTVDGSYVQAGKPVIDPTEGTLDEIGNILIDFGQPVTIVNATFDYVPQPYLESTDGGITLFASGQLCETENPNVLMWMQDGTTVKACDVVFTIPAGCVKYADGTTNAEYTYNYTITGANSVELNIVASTPELWSTVEELSEMIVTFDKAVTVGDFASATANDAFWAQQAYGTITATDDPKTIKISFPEPIRNFGETSIAIAAYSLAVDGKFYDSDIYLTVIIGESGSGNGDDPVPGEDVTITPAPMSDVASLRYFEITFGGYEGAWNEKPIRLCDQYDNEVARMGAYTMSGVSADGTWFWELGKPNTYSITLPTEITTEGYYVLTVPVVCEKADGSTVNREFSFMFHVDPAVGITLTQATGAQSETYTIGGVKINGNMKHGLYIVNGKKVMVGKTK